MTKKVGFISAAILAGSVLTPAQATDWSSHLELCAAAISDAGIANSEDYKVKFISGGGGATKRVLVKLISKNDGEDITAECRIRRGEVSDIDVKP